MKSIYYLIKKPNKSLVFFLVSDTIYIELIFSRCKRLLNKEIKHETNRTG